MKRITRASLVAAFAPLLSLLFASSAAASYRPPTGVTYDTSVGALCGDLTTTVFFRSGETRLELQEEPTLDYIASCLTSGALAGRHVAVVGYTDPSGSPEVDFELGEARAQAVTDYLVSKGVDREQLMALSLGASTAGQDRNTPSSWGHDRRVEMWVIQDGAPALRAASREIPDPDVPRLILPKL